MSDKIKTSCYFSRRNDSSIFRKPGEGCSLFHFLQQQNFQAWDWQNKELLAVGKGFFFASNHCAWMERSGVSEMVKALKKTDVCMQREHKGDWNSLKE